MKLSLGISPCPNDTFIFDALIHGRIDTEGLTFDLCMADVEELNRKAKQHTIHVTKLSFHAFSYVTQDYSLLSSGSALGRKNGPLLITREKLDKESLNGLKIAIPGRFTTANLLFSMFFPEVTGKKEYLFSDIEDALLRKEADAGLIIHENRFTYQEKGLLLLADLGEMWEAQTGHPIPLGGIAIDKSLPKEIQEKVARALKRSVQFAFEHPGSSYEFVKKHASELADEVIKKHIDLYVNGFTIDLGVTGKMAIRELFRIAEEKKVIPEICGNYFADE